MTPPDGFELMPPFGPLHEFLGPIFARKQGSQYIVGMRVETRHHNKGAMLHGGMMAFLIDTAFTYACVKNAEKPKPVVTTSMAVDFIGSAKADDWIEAHVDILRSGRRVIFLSCCVFSGSLCLARGSATFQVLGDT